MKALRTLLLGSAGAAMLFVAGSGAEAAGPPGVEAWKGKEPVWRCDTAAFIEYPGSDTCFKIGGTVAVWIAHAEDQVDTDGEGFNPLDIIAPDDHTHDDTTFMAGWARPYIDVRTATEYGVVRAYMEWQIGINGGINARHVFLQIGNWLWGFTTPTMHQGYGRPTLFSEAFGIPGDPEAVPRVNQIRYTFDVGNGVQINLAIQDPATNDAAYDAGFLAGSRNEVPDPVANIKVKTSWGGFGVSVGAHQHSATGFGGANDHRRPWGFGAIAGIDLNIGPNDTLMVQGSYGKGWRGSTDNGAQFEIGATLGGSTTKTESWGVVGGWEHQWGGGLSSTIAASYVENDYDGADGFLFNAFHPDATESVTSVWVNLIKEIVPGLELGVEVLWGHRDETDGDDNDAFGVSAQAVRKFP